MNLCSTCKHEGTEHTPFCGESCVGTCSHWEIHASKKDVAALVAHVRDMEKTTKTIRSLIISGDIDKLIAVVQSYNSGIKDMAESILGITAIDIGSTIRKCSKCCPYSEFGGENDTLNACSYDHPWIEVKEGDDCIHNLENWETK